MPLSNLQRAAANIRGYMGRVWIFNYANNTFVDGGPVRAPQIQITSVNLEADSEGRTPAVAYDFTITFTLLDMTSTLKNVLSSAVSKATVFFGKSASVTLPTYNAATDTFTGNTNGFLIVNGWLSVNASVNFAGEGDAYECQLTFRALPSDAAGLFDGTQNKIVLP